MVITIGILLNDDEQESNNILNKLACNTNYRLPLIQIT